MLTYFQLNSVLGLETSTVSSSELWWHVTYHSDSVCGKYTITGI